MKKFGLALCAFALVACGSQAAPSISPSNTSTNDIDPMPTGSALTEFTVPELGITLLVPKSNANALSTMSYDKQAISDLKDQTGCTDAVMVSFTSAAGIVYPLGAIYTCANGITLSGTNVFTKNNERIIFAPAAEKPVGLGVLESETYDNMLESFNSPNRYSAN
ncbi:MAG: hypothetical protein RL410_923 [Actinomycetota bacterium]